MEGGGGLVRAGAEARKSHDYMLLNGAWRLFERLNELMRFRGRKQKDTVAEIENT